MSSPRVSIIIPVYNVGPYVEDCIRSVMRQTYAGPMECIMVDDWGTDNSMEIVERLIFEYNGPISFNILHHTHNRGLSAARNTGMDAASGDYLFFLDSDDILTDDCINLLVKPLGTEWYDMVLGDIEVCNNVPLHSGLKLNLPDQTVLRNTEILNTYRTEWNMLAQNKLYRSQFIKSTRLKYFEGLIHEDELWSFQTACLATSLVAVRSTTYLYRIREGSIVSQSKGEKKARNISVLIKEISRFAKESNHFNEHTFQIVNAFFYKVLKFYSTNKLEFEGKYRELRPFVKPSIPLLIQTHTFHLQRYIRDLHFYLPLFVAPYWLHPYIKHRVR